MNEEGYVSKRVIPNKKLTGKEFADFHKETAIKEIDRVFDLGNPVQIEAVKESLEMMVKLFKTDAEASKAQEEINLYYQNKVQKLNHPLH